MAREVNIARLRTRRAARRARVMAYGQSIVILLLLVEMSNEYVHNEYFQAWTKAHVANLAFLLNGSLAAFYAGLMIAYYLTPVSRRRLGWRWWIEEEITVPNEALAG